MIVVMKRIFFFIIFTLAGISVFSQTSSSLRPSWARAALNPPAGANYFLNWGIGEGNTEQQAINDAWADALRKSLHELGVIGITQQDIEAVSNNGIDAVVAFNRMRRRLLCATSAIPQSNGKLRVYVMIQVQRDINGKDDFYDADPNICNDPNFDRELKKIEKQAGRNRPPVKNLQYKQESSFFNKGHNNYFAWSGLNVGYPFMLGTGIAGRFGGIVGVGYYLSFGFDFGGNSTYHVNDDTYGISEIRYSYDTEFITPLHYSFGLKFFPYKSVFLSAGYGTLGCEKMSPFNDGEGRWGMEGWRQGKGLIFTAGYDYLGNLKRDDGLFLSSSVGMSYDLFLDKWYPLINIKFGMAWSFN